MYLAALLFKDLENFFRNGMRQGGITNQAESCIHLQLSEMDTFLLTTGGLDRTADLHISAEAFRT